MRDIKKLVSFEDVMKIDIRMGEIVSVERVPKSEKLLKLEISFGLGDRKICVTNIGENLDKEDLIYRNVPFVVNMPPVKMMGIESEVMIMVGEEDDKERTFDLGLDCLGTTLLG